MAQLSTLGGFARMEKHIVMSDLFIGVYMTIPAIYFFVGMFSDATWLRPNWGRGFTRPSFAPLSRLSRWVWLLFCVTYAVAGFARAFHYHIRGLTSHMIPLLLIFIVLLVLSNIRDTRHFKSKHDPAA